MQKIRVSEVKERGINRVYSMARFLLGPLLGGALAVSTAQAQTNFQRILTFGPSQQTGSSPRELMEGSDGYLYGTTYAGGLYNGGSLFRINPNGTGFNLTFSFTNADLPYGGLVEGSSGALYGTTSGGGTNHAGTVFVCNKDGSGFAQLHVFPAFAGDGTLPACKLMLGKDGRLYGTTYTGGVSNNGTVFVLNADGSHYSLLHAFGSGNAGSDGINPAAAVIQAADGALYGTTEAGGTGNFGTVFKVQPDGTGYTVLHRFAGAPSDGGTCYGSLVQGPDGLLYGTTYAGGASDLGTIFRVDTNGNNYAVITSFAASSGNQPLAGLTLDAGGVFYGVTRYGGPANVGTVFKVNKDGSGYSTLHNFGILAGDGADPLASLLVGRDGSLYGSTYRGGAFVTNGVTGTLFRLSSSAPQVSISSISPQTSGYLIAFTGGAAGQVYEVQSTTNHAVAGWTAVGTNTAAIDGTFQFFDKACTNVPSRFYRSASF